MRSRAKKGYVLVWVTVVILGVMVLGLGLLQLGQAQGSEVVKEVWNAQAQNLAEGGIERALWKMTTDQFPTLFPNTWSGYSNVSLGPGSYTVTVASTNNASLPNEYLVTSVGTVARVSRTVSFKGLLVNGSWPWNFDYALYWANPSNSSTALSIQNNSSITGSAFGFGKIAFSNNAAVNGPASNMVYATGGITGLGAARIGTVPNPLPQKPALDTTQYTTWINTAASVTPAMDNMPAFFTWSSSTSTWSLSNNVTQSMGGGTHYSKGNLLIQNNLNLQNVGTLYVNGNVTIQNNAQLFGPGRIVASGTITISNNVHIKSGVDLVANGAISVQNNAASVEGTSDTSQTATVVYSPTSITFGNNATMNNIRIMSPGLVDISNNDVVNGLIWGGTVKLENNAEVKGAVCADSYYNNAIANNVQMIYDASVLQYQVPFGLPKTPPTITPEQWSDVSSTGI